MTTKEEVDLVSKKVTEGNIMDTKVEDLEVVVVTVVTVEVIEEVTEVDSEEAFNMGHNLQIMLLDLQTI